MPMRLREKIQTLSRQIKLTHVAVGVIIDSCRNVLISRRGAHQHQGDRWEFPGGKVEPGEGVEEALKRELSEELNIQVKPERRLLELRYNYPEKTVLLDVWLVQSFSGDIQGREGQAWCWVAAEDLPDYKFPDANAPIIETILKLQTGNS